MLWKIVVTFQLWRLLLGGICHKPLSSSSRENPVYFQFQLGYSVKLSVCLSVYIFHYFLKKDNILFGTIAGSKYLKFVVQILTISFIHILSLSPGEQFKGTFCPFMCIDNFFHIAPFLENHSIASYQIFYIYSWYYS